MSGQNSGGVPIFTIQPGGDSRIISVTDGRDNSHSSSADTFVKIVYEGKEVTSSEVKGYEKYSIITIGEFMSPYTISSGLILKLLTIGTSGIRGI